MADERWTFGASVPENYDRILVPILFDGYARDLAPRLLSAVAGQGGGAGSGDVLELACGTGSLTRCLLDILPSNVTLVASDLSDAMLDVARRRVPADPRLRWLTANAMELPVEAQRFAALACQFGLMFVPDPGLALREAHRVLRSQGRLVFSVWDGLSHNPHARIFEEVAQRFAPASALLDDFSRPFAMSDKVSLERLVRASGFEGVALEVVHREVVAPSAFAWARGSILGTPRGAQFVASKVPLEPVIEALAEAFAARGGEAPCRMPTQAIVVTASVRETRG